MPHIKELTDLVSGLVTSVSGLKDVVEQNTAAVEAYKEAAAKGFTIPAPGDPDGEQKKEDLGIYAPYDLLEQGKRLTDVIAHPRYQMTDAKRQELAKYFILLIKAGAMNDHNAKDAFHKQYGEISKGSLVDIGDPGNAFPLPEPLATEILAYARENSVVLQKARMWNMTSDKQEFPVETGGASVNWGNETEEGGPTISEVELSAEELSSYATVKNTTLADSISDIVSWIAEVMANAAGLELDNQAFNGTGSPFQGLLTYAGKSVTFAAGETGFDDVSFDYLSEVLTKLPGKRKIGAQWFMSGEVFHYIRVLKDLNDRPIFIDSVAAGDPTAAGQTGRILGYPWNEVTNMPTTSAANTPYIVFGNLMNLVLGRRLNSTALMVNPYAEWKKNRTLFKIYQRWGMKIALADNFVRVLTHS
jgi:HK97 family phage major capsid protein